MNLDGSEARALALLQFADGLEDAGYVETARRARVTARDCLEVCLALRSTAGALATCRARHEVCLGIIVARGYEANRQAIEALGG